MPNHPRLIPVYAYCETEGIPIVFHAGSAEGLVKIEKSYSNIDNYIPLLEQFPKLKIVLAHMGGLGAIDRAIKIGRKYPNLYFDTSIALSGNDRLKSIPGWLNDEKAVLFVKTVGADRILFGSDSPWGYPKEDIQRIRSLPITENEKQAVLGSNAVRIFRLLE